MNGAALLLAGCTVVASCFGFFFFFLFSLYLVPFFCTFHIRTIGNCIFLLRASYWFVCFGWLFFYPHMWFRICLLAMEFTYALAMYNARNVNRNVLAKRKSLLHRIINILRFASFGARIILQVSSNKKRDRLQIGAIASHSVSTGGQRHIYKANGHSLG